MRKVKSSKIAMAIISIYFIFSIVGCGGGGGGGGPKWQDELPTLVIASSQERGVCSTSLGPGQQLTFNGSGFITLDGVPPTVTFNGVEQSGIFAGCIDAGVPDKDVETCTEFTITVDTTGLEPGGVEVTLKNPKGVGTSFTTSAAFYIFDPPTVTNVDPSVMCEDVADTILTITGTNFSPLAKVTAIHDTGMTVEPSMLSYVSDTQMVATFPEGFDANTYGSKYDLVVSNGAGCDATATDAFVVGEWPLVFFTDPPVIYNGISTDVTVLTTGLGDLPQSVELIDDLDQSTPVPFTAPVRPNRIVATVDQGLDVGPYDIKVTSEFGCVGTLPDGLNSSDTISMTLANVEPQHVSPDEGTAVTIYLDDSSAASFVEMPRAYLNPVAGGSASALKAVILPDPSDHTVLTALVPEGLSPGLYDLIVVNPTGEIGLLQVDRSGVDPALGDGVVVVDGKLPTVTKVSPGAFTVSGSFAATVFGENFDDVAGVELELLCRDRVDDSESIHTATALSVTTTEISGSFDTSTLGLGDICLVGVTNIGDGARFDYSAVSIRSTSGNLEPWITDTVPMTVGRFGHGLVSARPTATSRYLYVIGGETDFFGTQVSSVEKINVSAFGDMSGNWEPTANADPNLRDGSGNVLPVALSFFGQTKIDDFIYLLGGNISTTSSGNVYRAQVLSPLDGPEVIDLDADLGDPSLGTGLDEGVWIYKVSARFPADDPKNPNGESLPGEVLVAQLPQLDDKLLLELTWEDVPGASGYRIYRTPAPNGSVLDIQMLTETDCGGLCECSVNPDNCSWTDDGTITQAAPTQADLPLEAGTLGTWHQPTVGNLGATPITLNNSRNGTSGASLGSPAEENVSYLYSFGGIDPDGTFLDTYEWSSVTIQPDGSQLLSAFTVPTGKLGTSGRAYGHTWSVDQGETDQIPFDDNGTGVMVPRAYLYFGGGFESPTTDTNELFSGYLDFTSTLAGTGGELLGLFSEKTPNFSVGGGTAIDANGVLYLMGGIKAVNGSISNQDSSTEIEGSGTPIDSLELVGWTAMGSGAITIKRAFAGIAEESAFFFVAGGQAEDPDSGLAIITNEVEQNTK